jgi:hypothetical protein
MRDKKSALPPHRLRLIRRLGGYASDAALVTALGITHSRWSNYLAGTYPLPIEIACTIVELIPGVDLDWIYRGVAEGLSGAILAQLRQMGEYPQPALVRRSSSARHA